MTKSLAAGSSQHAVYTGRATNWSMVTAMSLGALLLVPMAKDFPATSGDLMLALPPLLIAAGVIVNLLTACSVRATAGPNGLTVHWGLLGWPRCTYRLDKIERAEVADLAWWQVSYGFWWTPSRTNCTTHTGPAVRLVLHTGRVVTVTVPEPVAAVAVLQAQPRPIG